MIKIEGRHVIPPQVEGSPDVYSASNIVMTRPRWVADTEVTSCRLCDGKFNQLRRKHHCRQCGKVLCSKCCSDKSKIPLPLFGLSLPERVCDYCKPTADLINGCFSTVQAYRLQAAENMISSLKDTDGLIKVLEVGGLHTLIHLARVKDLPLRSLILSGLHQFSTHTALHQLLAETGAIKAISSVLVECEDCDRNLLTEGISTLALLAHSPALKGQVISDGGLDPVLRLSSSGCEALALMSLSMLSLLVEDASTHDAILSSGQSTLPKLLALVTHRDGQVQEVALRCLCFMSLGSDSMKQRIAQEDIYCGHQLLRTLTSPQNTPRNPQVLNNAACLVANLAASPAVQPSIKDLLVPLASLMSVYSHELSMMGHVGRGLANFVRLGNNAQLLVPYIPVAVGVFLKASVPVLQFQGLRLILFLLQHASQPTCDCLLRDGVGDLLSAMVNSSQVMASVQESLLREVSQEAKPN